MAEYPGLDVSEAEWIDEEQFMPRYNIAPRSNAPVIRRRDDGNLVIHTMKWGVVPHWSNHEDLTLSTINARAENLIESGGMWASIKGKKRCVVVCDGYFEWLKKGKDRLPHFTRRKDNKLMILAGLYDSVLLEGSSAPLWTFTVVTTDAASSFMWLHDRQPVILSTTKDFEAWLDTSKGWHSGLAGILKSGDGKDLECYPVPKEVGKVGTNSSTFIQPISQRKDGIQALFAKQAVKGKTGESSSTSLKASHNGSSTPDKTDMKSVPTASDDGKTTKRAIETEASPTPLSPDEKPSTKKQKLTHVHEPKTKRLADEEADQQSPTKKRTRKTELSPTSSSIHVDEEAAADGEQGAQGDNQFRKKPREKTPSTPKKIAKSKSNNDSGSAKITSFFRPRM